MLLNQPYPNGYALTKRMHLYAKGFIEHGNCSKIIIPLPNRDNKNLKNLEVSGIFEKVPFEYTAPNTIRNEKFIVRRVHNFIGTIKVGQILIKEKPDIVVTASFSIFFYVYLKLVSLIHSFKLIREKNEVDYLKEEDINLTKRLLLKFIYSLFDGIIVITKQLLYNILNDLNIVKKNLIVPVLISNRNQNKVQSIKKTIVYTGTYLERKDGIITILNAFAILKTKHPEYKLTLTGSPQRSSDYHKIMKIIETKDLQKHIDFTGYLSEEELQKTLLSATMLILAKPENRQNRYNFPTKIGEYLLSGRPVIATKVGVVADLLEDHKNIIFTENTITDILNKIEFVINNPEFSNQIGENGRRFAIENLDYLKHSKQMIKFFKSLN